MDITAVFGTVVGGSNPSGCTNLIMLLIDKPVGISSFGVVGAVRRTTGIKKVGHAGTLDPLASGLMLILVGREETKQAGTLLGLDKSYEATVRIGERRTTGDLEGDILEHVDMSGLDITRVTIENGLKHALKSMVDTLDLPVPAYSAIKRGGQRLYSKARKGQVFDLPVRAMKVYKAELLEVTQVTISGDDTTESRDVLEVKVLFTVASGVYIRSLSEELGKRLVSAKYQSGLPATTSALRRITIDKYSIKDAQTVDDVNNGLELIHHKIDV